MDHISFITKEVRRSFEMSKEELKIQLELMYKELMKIKSDEEFLHKCGFYEYDGEIGMIPVILKEDPPDVRRRKEKIIRKRIKKLKKKMPELYKCITLHKYLV